MEQTCEKNLEHNNPPNTLTQSFKIPTKCVKNMQDIAMWEKSEAYQVNNIKIAEFNFELRTSLHYILYLDIFLLHRNILASFLRSEMQLKEKRFVI